jgi:hypothetical protein
MQYQEAIIAYHLNFNREKILYASGNHTCLGTASDRRPILASHRTSVETYDVF